MNKLREDIGLECIEILPRSGKVKSAIIWLHGLGADGNDFVSLIDELNLPDSHGIKFIFPTANQRPITLNGGMIMNAWYDIEDLEVERDTDILGIKNSSEKVKNLINIEKNNGIPTNKIILGGFSQGGAMSLYSGLRYPHELGGIIALSSYCLLMDTLQAERSSANNSIPIFLAHGTFDPIVPFRLGKKSEQFLKDENYDVLFKRYPMEHTLCFDEIKDISAFIKEKLNIAFDY